MAIFIDISRTAQWLCPPARLGQHRLLKCEQSSPSPAPRHPMTTPSFPIRTECPPGTCVCDRDALLQAPGSDVRILQLTRAEEKKMLERLENLGSLGDLRKMQERMEQQLGIRLSITPSPHEVRSLRGIAILVLEQPGLCRKTRQAIPAAIKKSMEAQPRITYDLLNEGGLFADG